MAAMLRAEVAGLQMMLRQENQQGDTSIEKRLVAAILVKYFETGHSHDVLAVLSSMLSCTPEEQRTLGLISRVSTAHPDAKLSDSEHAAHSQPPSPTTLGRALPRARNLPAPAIGQKQGSVLTCLMAVANARSVVRLPHGRG
jgi:hypothetical protein